jgi:hypothetical protein
MDKFDKMIDDMEQFFNPKEGYCCHGWLIIRPDALILIEGIRKLQEENEKLRKAK